MSVKYNLKCISCENEFEPVKPYYVCPDCGGLLLVQKDLEFIKNITGVKDQAKAFFDSKRFSKLATHYPYQSCVWLWKDLILPGFPVEQILSLREGSSDTFETPKWLLEKIGLKNLFIKMCGQTPSSSFKDYGMTTGVSEALRLQNIYPELNIEGVACASTGDTSASMAIYSAYARDKIKSVIFVPAEKISPEQMSQVMAYGTKVIAIKHKDGFDGCMRLIQEFTAKHSELVLLNSKNPYRLAGQETIWYGLLQDLNWKMPKAIAIPCGNGGNLTALLCALINSKELGLIDEFPKIIVGQTDVSNTLVRWQDSDYKDYKPKDWKYTVASAMNINDPVSFPRIKYLLDQNDFDINFFDSSDKECLNTQALINSAGADICPNSAMAVSALLKAREKGVISDSDEVASISTANGVKFSQGRIDYHQNKANKYANLPNIVEGNIEDIEACIF